MKLKYISWIPTVVLMCIIFSFSAKTAVESDGSSLQIANGIVSIYEKINGVIPDISSKNEILEQVDLIVRKMAHGIEYAILAVCISFHLQACGIKSRKMLITAILLSGAYAATDEFHQLFVPGRSGQITDVVIDTTGSSIGATCYLMLVKLRVRAKARKKSTI